MKNRRWDNVVGLGVWAIAILIYIVPFYYVLVNSLKNSKESTVLSLRLPSEVVLQNFVVAFVEGNMMRGLVNSVIVAALSTTAIIVCSGLAAFFIQRSGKRIADFLFYLFVAGMALPISVVTTFALLKSIGLLNTLIGVSAIYTAIRMPFIIFMFTGFLKSVPRELDEAALIDGCTHLKMFIRIILPLLKPITVTSIIISVQFIWNNFDVILYFIQSSRKFTLPLSIYNFAGLYNTQWNLIFAGAIITVMPVLIIYVIGQKSILSGLTSGAVKG